jgi:hypothetical protein
LPQLICHNASGGGARASNPTGGGLSDLRTPESSNPLQSVRFDNEKQSRENHVGTNRKNRAVH